MSRDNMSLISGEKDISFISFHLGAGMQEHKAMSVLTCPIQQNDPAIPFLLFIYNAMIKGSDPYGVGDFYSGQWLV